MSKVVNIVHALEMQMAKDIVEDPDVAACGELDYHAVNESLHDRREAGITYSPERVLSLAVSLARTKQIPINRYNGRSRR